MKKTNWFPAHIKPVHIGWYETQRQNGRGISEFKWWFDGEFWLPHKDSGYRCLFQDRKWRGLAKKP